MTTDMHSVSRKPTVLRCTHIALLVFVYCCAWNCAADSTGSEDKAKSMSNPVSSLSKERVDERVGLILKRSGSNMNAMATSNLASTFFNPSELEKARQFCQQLGVDPYAQPFSSENGPDGLVFDRQDSATTRYSAQVSGEELGQARLCRALLVRTNRAKVAKSKPDAEQHKKAKRGRFLFDYDYKDSSENSGDSFSKKLDFLFANEGIRFKRNNTTGSSYLVRLYVPPSTSKPNLLQQLSRLGTTVTTSLAPLAPTFPTPLLGNSAASLSSHSDSLAPIDVEPSPVITGNSHPIQSNLQQQPIFGRLLMLQRPTEPKGVASSSWGMFSEESSPAALQLSDAEYSSAEPIRFVKKNPFDKEGLRFKRAAASLASGSSSFEVNYVGYPFANEGIRFKKSPFDEEGIRYKKSSPFADEGIRYKKSPFDEEGIRYKKSPFDAEGIRFKKSPFDEEGIRYKKSSPFAEEGIRYKKSPFEAEGIRY